MKAHWKTTRLNVTLTKRESDVRKEEKREELGKILSIETFRIFFTLSILSISIHLLPCFQFLQSSNAKTSLPLSPLSPSDPSMQRVYQIFFFFTPLTLCLDCFTSFSPIPSLSLPSAPHAFLQWKMELRPDSWTIRHSTSGGHVLGYWKVSCVDTIIQIASVSCLFWLKFFVKSLYLFWLFFYCLSFFFSFILLKIKQSVHWISTREKRYKLWYKSFLPLPPSISKYHHRSTCTLFHTFSNTSHWDIHSNVQKFFW